VDGSPIRYGPECRIEVQKRKAMAAKGRGLLFHTEDEKLLVVAFDYLSAMI
jgi:hypothetical protein